jgi:hypothetical protein
MSWDYGFFNSKNNVFRKKEQPNDQTSDKPNVSHCAGCNHPIGVISTTFYEFDENFYCTDCYAHLVANKPLEKEHNEIKPKKEALNQVSP